ncbi:HPt (histidine-containing phosphotransfer) domain-containing protein [Nitrosomonas ureae]|uniref:HPt (Histidine-containing phosphotransfer) domain-containing protein n=1 Tax=Nitrosomonas ureae TaxID=44577 RepID=A0A285BYY6_9PROT|nr:Hpt domain-containing protein [Nitrosomonas ureae]SNX60106.1 HPt (histidine-containing phosphotransfer) domain-containing protein [Nitrosomonas ureae]
MINEVEKESLPDTSLPVDIVRMRQMFHDNSVLVQKFCLKFIEVANNTLSEMEVAQGERDLPALGRLGHKLKSSARTIGALSFADICEALEKASANNNWFDAESLMVKIRLLLKQITEQLENELSQLSE